VRYGASPLLGVDRDDEVSAGLSSRDRRESVEGFVERQELNNVDGQTTAGGLVGKRCGDLADGLAMMVLPVRFAAARARSWCAPSRRA